MKPRYFGFLLQPNNPISMSAENEPVKVAPKRKREKSVPAAPKPKVLPDGVLASYPYGNISAPVITSVAGAKSFVCQSTGDISDNIYCAVVSLKTKKTTKPFYVAWVYDPLMARELANQNIMNFAGDEETKTPPIKYEMKHYSLADIPELEKKAKAAASNKKQPTYCMFSMMVDKHSGDAVYELDTKFKENDLIGFINTFMENMQEQFGEARLEIDSIVYDNNKSTKEKPLPDVAALQITYGPKSKVLVRRCDVRKVEELKTVYDERMKPNLGISAKEVALLKAKAKELKLKAEAKRKFKLVKPTVVSVRQPRGYNKKSQFRDLPVSASYKTKEDEEDEEDDDYDEEDDVEDSEGEEEEEEEEKPKKRTKIALKKGTKSLVTESNLPEQEDESTQMFSPEEDNIPPCVLMGI